jgi:ATP-dependent protease HslVU (ClpYQ) ATPase subunit
VKDAHLTVDEVYVADKLKAIKDDEDLSRYIL